MRTIKKSLLLTTLVMVFLFGLPGLTSAQQSTSFKVAGPCAKCGSERLITLVKKMDGVNKVAYDAQSFLLSIDYNDAVASEIDIQLSLSQQGYDAGDFQHDATAQLPACATGKGSRGDAELGELGVSDLEGVDDPANWESAQNLSELEALGRRGDDDAVINDDALLADDSEDDSEELLNWEPIDLEDEE